MLLKSSKLSDKDLNWSLSSSKLNLHLSFWPFFDLSSVV